VLPTPGRERAMKPAHTNIAAFLILFAVIIIFLLSAVIYLSTSVEYVRQNVKPGSRTKNFILFPFSLLLPKY